MVQVWYEGGDTDMPFGLALMSYHDGLRIEATTFGTKEEFEEWLTALGNTDELIDFARVPKEKDEVSDVADVQTDDIATAIEALSLLSVVGDETFRLALEELLNEAFKMGQNSQKGVVGK